VRENEDASDRLSAFHVPRKKMYIFHMVMAKVRRSGRDRMHDWHHNGALIAAMAHLWSDRFGAGLARPKK
jgi:hypothetical protein